ncbi:hypothetical protein BJ741DRAFT_618429 [Chytriomyces cf. hyalinus JEL632]|nr:hypothetical protein BJ741DRAFT_618429 [Chytriomyces cf. hyalinus JEL632]
MMHQIDLPLSAPSRPVSHPPPDEQQPPKKKPNVGRKIDPNIPPTVTCFPPFPHSIRLGNAHSSIHTPNPTYNDHLLQQRQQELNRANGRAFRERQKQQFASLQMQVAEFHDLTNSLRQSLSQLQDENNGLRSTISQLETANATLLMHTPPPRIVGPPCTAAAAVGGHNCAAESERCVMLETKVAQLEAKLKEYEKPWGYQQMVSASTLLASFDFVFGAPTDSSVTSSSPDRLRNGSPESINSSVDVKNEDFENGSLKTSEQLFGGIKVEFARYSLQSIDSLKGNPLIDQALDSLISASKTCEKQKLRKYLMRTFMAQAKILSTITAFINRKDHCQIHDIFNTLRAFNRQHLDYMLDMIVDKEDLKRLLHEQRPVSPETEMLATSLKEIRSLASAHAVIDEICILSSLPKVTPEILMELRKRREILENLCVPGSEESHRLRFAMKKHRPGNKEDMMRRLEEAMNELDVN